MRKFALTIAAILVMGSAFGQVWSYDWHGACTRSEADGLYQRGKFIYIIGGFDNYFQSLDFDPTTGSDSLSSATIHNGFVTKMDTAGNYFWSIPLHGQQTYLTDIAVDASGNVFVLGGCGPTNFDLDPSQNQSVSPNGYSWLSYIAVYDSMGNYLKHLECNGNIVNGYRLAIDDVDNLYLGGSYNRVWDFDVFSGVDTIRPFGLGQSFVTKINPMSETYFWTRIFGSSDSLGNDYVQDLEISKSKIAVLGAYTGNAAELNPWGTGFLLTNPCQDSSRFQSYLSMMDTSGNFLNGAGISGKLSEFSPFAVGIANNGETFAVGYASSAFDTVKLNINGNSYTVESGREESNVLLKFDAQLNPDWYKVISSSSYCEFPSIVCNDNRVYISGYFADTIFDYSNGVEQIIDTSPIDSDPRTLIGYLSDGTYMGVERDHAITPVSSSFGQGIQMDADENLYIVANFNGTGNVELDLDPGSGVASTSATSPANTIGGYYILKLNFNGFVATENPHSPAQVLVYPNPATQDLRIQSESPFSKVTLQDLQGRVLMSQTFDAVQSQTLDMSAISSGVYLLTIEGEMGRVTSKVVKQ